MDDNEMDGAQVSRIALPICGMTLDLGREELLNKAGKRVEIRSQALQVLRYLALNAGRIVTKDELHKVVWPDTVVTDDSLVQAVGDLRRVLGDTNRTIIKTVPRRGYEMVANAVAHIDQPVASTDNSQTTIEDTTPLAPLPTSLIRHFMPWGMLALVVLVVLIVSQFPSHEENGLTAAQTASQAIAGDTTPMPDRPSIAVLAFRDPKGDDDGQILARGVAEELISELARNADLRVVSWYSSFKFAGNNIPLKEIGRQLRSIYLVDGTVQRDNELLRVNVQMIDSNTGRIVWSTKYVADSSEVPIKRDKLVQRIAGSLHSQMRTTEERQVMLRAPKNLDVYEMTLRAIALKHRFNPKATREARSLLEQVVAIDPSYAPGWLYLGMVNAIDSALRLTGEWTPARYEEILAQSQRAIQLDPRLPAAYFGLGISHSEGRQFAAALKAAEQCVALGPSDADCHMFLSKMQIRFGQVQAATASIEQALDLSPVPPAYIISKHALVLWANKRFKKSLQRADECLEKAPKFLECRRVKVLSLAELGQLEQARAEIDTIRAQLPSVSVNWFSDALDDSATELRTRVTAASLTVFAEE